MTLIGLWGVCPAAFDRNKLASCLRLIVSTSGCDPRQSWEAGRRRHLCLTLARTHGPPAALFPFIQTSFSRGHTSPHETRLASPYQPSSPAIRFPTASLPLLCLTPPPPPCPSLLVLNSIFFLLSLVFSCQPFPNLTPSTLFLLLTSRHHHVYESTTSFRGLLIPLPYCLSLSSSLPAPP